MNDSSKKLVLISPNLTMGGAQRQLIIFANTMSAADWKIDIIVFTNMLELSDELIPDIKVNLIKGSTLNNPLVWIRTRKLLSKIKPDVVVGWGSINLLAIVTRMPWNKWRVVICERVYLPILTSDIFSSSIKRKLILVLLKYFYKYANIVTANSKKNLSFLRSYVGKGPLYLHLPNAVDITSSQSLINYIPTDIPHDGEPYPHILAVGRLVSQKGFDLLFDALAIVRKKTNWKLVLVGDGSERENLKKKAAKLGILDSIIMLGAKMNLTPYYNWADIVVVPSRYEGFPNVPLEAMAYKCSVICTDCMTGPRELTKDGHYGILVQTDDPKAMANAILNLGDNPEVCRDMGNKAYMHVKLNYDIQKIAPIYKTIINRALE